MAYPALLHHTRPNVFLFALGITCVVQASPIAAKNATTANTRRFDLDQGLRPWRRGAFRRSTTPKELSFDAVVSEREKKENTKVSHVAVKIPVKRKLGRPPKDPSERRTERVDVFFSVAERLKLSEDAKACGLSPASYIRKLVAGFRPTAQAEHSADPRLLLELNAIGNNVGQTVRAIKADTAAKADWQQLKRDVEDVLQMVALDEVLVSPKLLLQLHATGSLLNRAVADMHAGSQRKHDWRELRLTLHNLLMEVATSDVH